MGGRGSFSGLLRTIDDVLGINEGKGTVHEISTDSFPNLEQTENLIRRRKKEVLVVFDKAGNPVKAYQGERHSVAFPVEEAKKWKGFTVTHNHPGGVHMEGFGGTFSFADMRNATVYEFGSHRAVAAGQGERNYILHAGPNAKPMELNRRIAADIPALQKRMQEEANNVKKEYSQKNGTYKNYGHALHVARQKTVGVLNSYYREVAEQYGYIYRAQK